MFILLSYLLQQNIPICIFMLLALFIIRCGSACCHHHNAVGSVNKCFYQSCRAEGGESCVPAVSRPRQCLSSWQSSTQYIGLFSQLHVWYWYYSTPLFCDYNTFVHVCVCRLVYCTQTHNTRVLRNQIIIPCKHFKPTHNSNAIGGIIGGGGILYMLFKGTDKVYLQSIRRQTYTVE